MSEPALIIMRTNQEVNPDQIIGYCQENFINILPNSNSHPNEQPAIKPKDFIADEDHLKIIMTQLLTVKEFKARFSISHTAFYREVAAQRIPIRKIGRSTRIALSDAEAWAEKLPTSS